MRLAGLKECGLCCEIMREDGTMMRTTELLEFAKEHNLHVITIEDLIKKRLEKESTCKKRSRGKNFQRNMEISGFTDIRILQTVSIM